MNSVDEVVYCEQTNEALYYEWRMCHIVDRRGNILRVDRKRYYIAGTYTRRGIQYIIGGQSEEVIMDGQTRGTVLWEDKTGCCIIDGQDEALH